MNWKAFLTNWKTTLGGVLVAAYPLVQSAGFTLTPREQHWLALAAGVGALLLGGAAKDFNTHSTQAEVEQSTAAAKGK